MIPLSSGELKMFVFKFKTQVQIRPEQRSMMQCHVLLRPRQASAVFAHSTTGGQEYGAMLTSEWGQVKRGWPRNGGGGHTFSRTFSWISPDSENYMKSMKLVILSHGMEHILAHNSAPNGPILIPIADFDSWVQFQNWLVHHSQILVIFCIFHTIRTISNLSYWKDFLVRDTLTSTNITSDQISLMERFY